jgi:hypothetical protein
MGLLRSKRTFGQANTQEPARRRARTARASNESNSLIPTNGDSLRRPEDRDDDVAPYDGTSNSAAPDTTTPEGEAPKSIGPFLGKFPQKIRDTIYEYVLDFNNEPMAHFGNGISHWTMAQWQVQSWLRARPEEHEYPPEAIDLSILSVSKAIHGDALSTFYRTQTISLNRLQCRLIFKRDILEQPEAFPGGLRQARYLLLRRHWADLWFSPVREHNTIDLDSFFARMRSIFPHLSSVTVLVDYLEHPNSSLFEIGSDLMDCNRVTKVTFDAVGSLVADTIFGFTIRVKHQWLARNWQRGMATPLDPTRKWLRRPRAAICISLFESKKILESARTNTLAERWHHGLQEQIMSVDREM